MGPSVPEAPALLKVKVWAVVTFAKKQNKHTKHALLKCVFILYAYLLFKLTILHSKSCKKITLDI